MALKHAVQAVLAQKHSALTAATVTSNTVGIVAWIEHATPVAIFLSFSFGAITGFFGFVEWLRKYWREWQARKP